MIRPLSILIVLLSCGSSKNSPNVLDSGMKNSVGFRDTTPAVKPNQKADNRFIQRNWDGLTIHAASFEPITDTTSLNGFLEIEVMKSNCTNNPIILHDSTRQGNHYFLKADIIPFDSVYNRFRSTTTARENKRG